MKASTDKRFPSNWSTNPKQRLEGVTLIKKLVYNPKFTQTYKYWNLQPSA